jgi:hypothetical protein
MSLEPKVGWLLSYSYLWADDHRRGDEEGIKNRPCALVAATRRDGDRIVAVVVPVTHSPPDPLTAIEIPAITKTRLGLDAQRSWIICNEASVFAWPGPDLRAATGRAAPSIWYGPLPPKLAAAARDKLLEFARAGRLRRVPRTE